MSTAAGHGWGPVGSQSGRKQWNSLARHPPGRGREGGLPGRVCSGVLGPEPSVEVWVPVCSGRAACEGGGLDSERSRRKKQKNKRKGENREGGKPRGEARSSAVLREDFP